MFICVHLGFLLLCSCAQAQPNIIDARWLPLTQIEREALEDHSGKLHDPVLWFTPYNTRRPKVPQRHEIFADRNEYLADDPFGQFVVYFVGADHTAPGAQLVLEVVEGESGDGKVVASRTFTRVPQPKVAVLVETGKLAPGTYRMRARLVNMPGGRTIADRVFKKSAQSRKAEPFPQAGVPLIVHEQSQVPDAYWPITTGVPLPRGAANSVDRFVLLENGKPVAAQFTQRGTWHPQSSAGGADLKWIGLDFLAKYDAGKPRQYTLVRLPDGQAAPAIDSPLTVAQDGDVIVINTGAIAFKINRRRFAGLEDVRFVNVDGTLSDPVTSDAVGGPFLSDERKVQYTAALDEHTSVTVEESGPVRVTIAATGWYTSDRNEKCCIYQTRISAFAGQPRVHVNHRTVITFDTDQKKLGSLGFLIPVVGSEAYAFGVDGKAHEGALPAPTQDAKGKPVAPETVWLHQDRWDRLRVMQGEATALAEGQKSDGWAAVSGPRGSMTLAVRNLWQLFPKEVELSREGVTFHAWPRHGHVAFTEEEELSRHHIHKLFYAHQGQYLDLKLPQKYFEAFPRIVTETKGPRGPYAFLEQQDINALTGNGRGTAVSNDFCVIFTREDANVAASAKPRAAAPKEAALFQQNPHAISDPVYNGLTEVEGRFAGINREKFPQVERALDEGFRGFTMSVDLLNNYGMWVWPDTHNNWSLIDRTPQSHRWWLNSHYQGVWEGTFLYLRSGIEWIGRWAADNTEHFMNIGTVNYDDPADLMQGKIKGANYHTKGFTPWGSPRLGERTGDDYVEVGAHFINPDAFIIRWYLMGDHRALDLAQAWGAAFGRVALPPERSRECNTTLGEMISYYEATWDPQAIVYIRDLADDHNSRPWREVPAFPTHPTFHDRWIMRYWNLTRDPLIQQRLTEWLTAESDFGYPHLRALAWRWTGDVAYLTKVAPIVAGVWRSVYDNPNDPLHTYGGRGLFFPTPSIGETLPYFMQALIDAGLELPPVDDSDAKPIARAVEPKKDQATNWFTLPERWYTGNGVFGYLRIKGAAKPVTLEVSAVADQSRAEVCYLRVDDAVGKTLLETTVLATSQRESATVTLNPAASKQPWKIYRKGLGHLKWIGDVEGVTFSPTPE